MLATARAAAPDGAFRTRWDGRRAVAVESLANTALPTHCDLAVVGAGWGGAYLAWRLAVDTDYVAANRTCVFEANGRVGGRVYSVHDLPHFGDLAVDVGGYRFQESQLLPAQLVWKALELPTTCYDYGCQAECEGPQNCFVIKDAYGNNAGYATPIERMLGELEAKGGPGTQTYFGVRLEALSAAPLVGPRATRLHFAGGASVTASRVLLNLPGNAVAALSNSSVIFDAPSEKKILESVSTFSMNKVYAWYDDAWWSTKLGKMEGYFHGGMGRAAPLYGRYHDGPQRCLIGHDTAGRPIYSGTKVPYGNCSGALEVYYSSSAPYYEALMESPLEPLTVATAEDGKAGSATLLADVHAHLMSHHAAAFANASVDPATIAPPKAVVVANWIADGAFTPGIGRLMPGTDAERAKARKPAAGFDVYVADQDYGYHTGWAMGSLTMAEKVLQAELGLMKPAWLDEAWYDENVVRKP